MMILLAAAAIAFPPPSPAAATVQARAMIRVVRAVHLKLDGSNNPGLPHVRDAMIKVADGSSSPAKLIEFQ